jgi:YVTN family beta-propeller protein
MRISRTASLPSIHRCVPAFLLWCGMACAQAQGDFVNFETPPVHPLDLSPDGARLAMAHGADGRVEIFKFPTAGKPVAELSLATGIDPVSVRWRNATELWVVNHVSDSVSIVDMASRQVVATLKTEDEPCDVVFAGSPQRAFVSCSVGDVVLVYDPANREAAPQRVPLLGEDPRALAVSPDGSKVYVAIFESGNSSTILAGGGDGVTITFPPNAVSDPRGPYGGVNPPPNKGTNFFPAKNPNAGNPPKVGLIVKKNAAGAWMDDNAHDWTALVSGPLAAGSGRPVGWDVIDNDVAIIDAATLSLSYATRMMNLCMSLAVNPASGKVMLVGTEATNEVRFEPVVNGTFVRVMMGTFDAATPGVKTIRDLNPHLDYSTHTIAPAQRELSIGDPRAVAWRSSGARGYVAGMGSNNVIAIDANGARIPGLTIETGEGPCGLAVDEARGQLYVFNRFGGSLSVVSLTTETETSRVSFFDPTPAAIKAGRPLLYDTHRTSGLGQVSCASCHADARTDRLAWDLGDPSGGIKSVSGTIHNFGAGIPGLTSGFTNFRPMKGPMTTQTMQDIIGKEPLHWRGDRNGIEEFNGAFVDLLGDDVMLTAAEMTQFKAYLASLYFPPNPYRNPDNTLPENLPLPGHFTTGRFGPAGQPLPNGNAKRALDTLYRPVSRGIDGSFSCATCHNLPIGIGTDTVFNATLRSFLPIAPGPNGERHHALVSTDGSTQRAIKIPQLRNMYDKVGFEMTQQVSRSGFGFAHDGAVDSLARFMTEGAFTTASDQEVADLVALMLGFTGSEFGAPVDGAEPPGTSSQDTHAAVGRQAFLTGMAQPAAEAVLLNQLVGLATAGKIDLVAHATINGTARGWMLIPAGWQSDEKTVVETLPALLARATAGTPVGFTAVVRGTGRRLGIDRDRDGLLDFDETRDLALSVPGIQNPFRADAFDTLGNAGAAGADGTADGQNDFDNDGMSNEAELAAGTNPADQLAVDVPMQLRLASSGTPFTISLIWQTAAFGQYEVSWSADLMQWTPLATGPVDAPAGGGAHTWTDNGLPATPGAPSAAAKRFYRVNRLK